VADPAMLAAPHPGHDVVRIAAAADRADGPLPTLTQALLAACTECARLHADLLALAAALPSAATPRRTRDFTLTAADAERLRPRGLRRWLGLVGTSRDTITRPLAIGFTTLGLVGLLLTTVPTALPMGGAGAAASAAPPVTEERSGPTDGGFEQTIDGPDTPGIAIPAPAPSVPAEGPDAVLLLSGGFLAAGVALGLVRRSRARGMR
jgi:anti-sigma factor RsiW